MENMHGCVDDCLDEDVDSPVDRMTLHVKASVKKARIVKLVDKVCKSVFSFRAI